MGIAGVKVARSFVAPMVNAIAAPRLLSLHVQHATALGVEATSAAIATSATASRSALAGAAVLLVGCAVKGQGESRTKRVAARALGSIEQFKVFGPADDRFEIETDKILGVGGQGTVYLCHKQSDPATKYAVKTIPIWRLLMDPSSDALLASIEKEVSVLTKISGHPNVAECIGC